MNNKAELLIKEVKDKIINSTDNFMVEMILNSTKVLTYRYKYDTDTNQMTFNFGKYEVIMDYNLSNNTSKFKILTQEDNENDEDPTILIEFEDNISNVPYSFLLPKQKIAFKEWLEKFGCKIDSKTIYDTFVTLYKNVMKKCKKDNYGGYY